MKRQCVGPYVRKWKGATPTTALRTTRFPLLQLASVLIIGVCRWPSAARRGAERVDGNGKRGMGDACRRYARYARHVLSQRAVLWSPGEAEEGVGVDGERSWTHSTHALSSEPAVMCGLSREKRSNLCIFPPLFHQKSRSNFECETAETGWRAFSKSGCGCLCGCCRCKYRWTLGESASCTPQCRRPLPAVEPGPARPFHSKMTKHPPPPVTVIFSGSLCRAWCKPSGSERTPSPPPFFPPKLCWSCWSSPSCAAQRNIGHCTAAGLTGVVLTVCPSGRAPDELLVASARRIRGRLPATHGCAEGPVLPTLRALHQSIQVELVKVSSMLKFFKNLPIFFSLIKYWDFMESAYHLKENGTYMIMFSSRWILGLSRAYGFV